MKMPNLNTAMIDGAEARAAQADRGPSSANRASRIRRQFFIAQRYAGYSEENQEAWQTLYDGQMDFLARPRFGRLPRTAPARSSWCEITSRTFEGEHSINRFLEELTGWESRAVPGYLPSPRRSSRVSRGTRVSRRRS